MIILYRKFITLTLHLKYVNSTECVEKVSCGGNIMAPGCDFCFNNNINQTKDLCGGNCTFDEEDGTCKEKG